MIQALNQYMSFQIQIAVILQQGSSQGFNDNSGLKLKRACLVCPSADSIKKMTMDRHKLPTRSFLARTTKRLLPASWPGFSPSCFFPSIRS